MPAHAPTDRETYVPELDGDAFREALRRDRFRAEWMLYCEARSMKLFIDQALKAEGFGWFFSWPKGRRRGRLYAQAHAAVLEEAGDLGPFALENVLFMGYVGVRDLEKEEAARIAKIEAARTERDAPPPEPIFRDARTNQVRTAEQKGMDILFGRARMTDFEQSGGS